MPWIKRNEDIRKVKEVLEKELYIGDEDLPGCSRVWRW
jgi:hypothetical protein